MPEIRERRPPGRGWSEFTPPRELTANSAIVHASGWVSGPIVVFSTLDMAKLPDGSGVGLQWHISVRAKNGRPKPHHVRRALRAFGMVGSEQDNHEPGRAKHFWLTVDPAHRVDCECKSDETTVIERDGHRWQAGSTPDECGACMLASAGLGRSCPVHGEAPR